MLAFILAALAQGELGVEHAVVAELGPERMRNTAWRRGRDGERLVAWGRRILEWAPRAGAEAREAVPARDGSWYSNGGCVLDVDGDGAEELVVVRTSLNDTGGELVWFEERKGEARWTPHRAGKIDEEKPGSAPHDLRPLVAKGFRGVVGVIGRRKLVAWEIPAPPTEPWVAREIATLPAPQQSGLAVGDVAGRGRPDVVCGMFWAEHPADPRSGAWTVRRFGDYDKKGWGGMAKVALGDFDGDGRLEIAASEAEIPEARLGLFSRREDGTWEFRAVDRGLYCPHSLLAADLDGDGRLDLVAGEMSAGGWNFPLNPKPRLLAYLNRGGGAFERRTLAEGWGVHEMGAVSAPGRLVLYAADEIQPQKFRDMRTHVSLWTLPRRR